MKNLKKLDVSFNYSKNGICESHIRGLNLDNLNAFDNVNFTDLRHINNKFNKQLYDYKYIIKC